MWTTTILTSALLASTSSATFLDLFGRANRLCPAVSDIITVTSTLSITVAAVTVMVTPTIPSATLSTNNLACLSDAQANSIVESWKTVVAHVDHDTANTAAQKLIAEEFLGTSDSINSLTELSLGNITFSGKAALIAAKLSTPPISQLTTLDIFHDCSRIAFYWAGMGIGSGTDEVKGVDLLYLTDDGSQINMVMTEFNSLAWAKDVGWKMQNADGTQF